MKTHHLLLALILLLAACEPAPSTEGPVDSADLASLVTASTSESDLIEQLGAENVRRDSFHVGEGFYEITTVLYPDDPTRRVYILWIDDEHTIPDWVRVTDPESTWSISRIEMETSLTELEHLNNRSFQLTGFGWDYGGTIIGWNGGQLETAFPGILISLRLGLAEEVYESEDVLDILGDGNFSSTHPVMQKLNPRVEQIGIWFDR